MTVNDLKKNNIKFKIFYCFVIVYLKNNNVALCIFNTPEETIEKLTNEQKKQIPLLLLHQSTKSKMRYMVANIIKYYPMLGYRRYPSLAAFESLNVHLNLPS